MLQPNIEVALCNYLKTYHTGRINAASSKTLEKMFRIKGSDVRKTVNSLRCAGFPVCSDTVGYYYAATQEEINSTIAQLNGRITKISNARNGLLASLSLNSVPVVIDVSLELTIAGGESGNAEQI